MLLMKAYESLRKLTKAYSEDLRRKIVAAVERGMPKTEAARTFGVGLSSLKRYSVGWRPERSPSPPARAAGGPPRPTPPQRGERLLEEDVGRRPYASAHERAGFLRAASGVALSESTVRRLLRRLGFSQKNGAWAPRSARSS